jgi:hypothetical protein
MNTVTATFSNSLLRTMTLGTHGFMAAWLLINGVAHQVGVLWKARAGTLRPDADVSSLLAVGAGLIIAGGVMSWTLGTLSRASAPSSLPAFAGLGVLAAVLAAVAARYGFTFLRGSIALGVINVGLLAAYAVMGAR